jgi:hypothetical protein
MERGIKMADLEMPLPGEDDPAAIFTFAMSFNGYEEFGSFEASAEAARQKGRRTLREIRNELFFAARASRHGGCETYVDVYRELVPLLRSYAACHFTY